MESNSQGEAREKIPTLEVLRKEREEALKELSKKKIKVKLMGSKLFTVSPSDGFILFKLAFFGNPMGVRKAKRDEKYNVPYILSFYEVVYLLEKGVIEVERNGEKLDISRIIELAENEIKSFTHKYRVYRDLRDRGYVLRPGMKFGSDFAVYIYGPGIDHAPFLVTVFSEKTDLLGIDLIRAGRLATSVRKNWVIATLENDKVRYYVFNWLRL